MVRRKDDGGTAVAEPVNPNDIASRVAAADAAARREQVVRDVQEWRRIIVSIADGHEPDGKMLAAIGDIGRRLRLPPDAVSKAVTAVQEERRLQGEVDATKQRLAATKAREVELAAEMKAAESKLLALREELAEYHGMHQGYPYQVHAVAAVRAENPVMFADAANVADRLLAADTGMGTEVFNGMKPQEWRADGQSPYTWGK